MTSSPSALPTALAALFLCALAGPAGAEPIGEVDTAFKLIGPDHKIVVEAYDDPKVGGVTCYVARARSSADERVVTVRLTDTGMALRTEVAPVHTKIAALAGMQDDDQRHRLITELQELTARLQLAD